METTRFEYRVWLDDGTNPRAEQLAWERLGAELALALSHQLADGAFRVMRATKDVACDYNTNETVFSITLELIGEDREYVQMVLSDVLNHSRVDDGRRTRRRAPRRAEATPATTVFRPGDQEAAEIARERAPVRRILLPPTQS